LQQIFSSFRNTEAVFQNVVCVRRYCRCKQAWYWGRSNLSSAVKGLKGFTYGKKKGGGGSGSKSSDRSVGAKNRFI